MPPSSSQAISTPPRRPASTSDEAWMQRALELAQLGQGYVEPNPMVGCVLVREGRVIAEGYHGRYGGPHAEVVAAGDHPVAGQWNGATLYLTLEPCSHWGKTPPCSELLVRLAPSRVVIACRDPCSQVDGRGIDRLQTAGIPTEVGCLAEAASQLIAPFRKLQLQRRPWVIAKWAMSLDGKIATRSGDSQWISSGESRQRVHQLRGRVDAILVGSRTALADDPLLTARPPGPRTPLRVVIDSRAGLPPSCRLATTATQFPTLLWTSPAAPADALKRLRASGVEAVVCAASTPQERLLALLDELGHRRCTNLLVEGGGQLLGSLRDLDQIDEAQVFIAPLLIGGQQAPGPMSGSGADRLCTALHLDTCQWLPVGSDILGIARRCSPPPAAVPTSDSRSVSPL
jgi:diaminohydroxyphosphoribosylaminopyrimidine deaminase / 5-amino-6-(5-phosphoribosylamino)uracil reductase